MKSAGTKCGWFIFIAVVLSAGYGVFTIRSGKTDFGSILLQEDFSDGDMKGWWVEGGEKVWVQDGRLHVKANPSERNQSGEVCTVWYKKKFKGDIEISFDAHVMGSEIDANNINFFFHYTHPDEGQTIWSTRHERADGAYVKYHNLNGYIATFLNDFNRESSLNPDGTLKARLRLRRCPGFQMMSEGFDYHCRAGITYHCKIVKKGGHIEFYVDGRKLLEADDENFLNEGYIGLRTFRTYLWWDNIIVRGS